MSVIDGLRYRFESLRRALFDRGALRRALDDELQMHLELEAMQQAHGGAPPAVAARAARARFGDPRRVRERLVDATGISAIDALQQDVRFAARTLRTRPAFTAIAVLTLAIGIGANTAIFGAVDALLLRPLPYHEPERLMTLSLAVPAFGSQQATSDVPWSYPKFALLRESQRDFAAVALWFDAEFTVRIGDDTHRLAGEAVEMDYLSLLGVPAMIGRAFGADDGAAGAPRVAVVSETMWERGFGADSAVIGRTMEIDGTPYVVIGVMPHGFGGLSGRAAFWMPLTAMPLVWQSGRMDDPYSHQFRAIGRLAPGATPAGASRSVVRIGARIDAAYPDRRVSWSAAAGPLDAARVDGRVRRTLFVLVGAVALVLLIACVNVANLLLVRANGRRRELAVRVAIGAGRGRLVRQLLTESALLAALGGAASLVVSWCGVALLTRVRPFAVMRNQTVAGLGAVDFADIHLDPRTFAATAALTLATGLLFGVLPALQASQASVTTTLKDDAMPRGPRLRALASRNVLAVAEISLAVVLLVASTLMIRSLGHLLGISPGFRAEHVMTMRVNRAPAWSRDSIARFYDVAIARLSTIPGVHTVAMADCPPLNGGCSDHRGIRLPDRAPPPAGAYPAGLHWITPAWPRVVGIPLVRGRLFTMDDRASTRDVVLVSETAARTWWPDEDPIGRPLLLGLDGDTSYVAGVVGDVRYESLDEPPTPDVYVSYYQRPVSNRMMFFLGTSVAPSSVTNAARQALREVAPGFPVYATRTLEEVTADATAYARVSAQLLTLFAGVALLLAAIGIYGVVSFSVAQRARELAVRTALGATRRDLVTMVVGHGTRLGALGAVIGIGGALGATRVLRSLLYGVAPTDPASYAAIVFVLTAVVVAACWLPARRAAGASPTQVLRST